MKNIIDRIVNWLWLSSQHPDEVSLTAKSSLLVLASGLSVALGFSHLQVGPEFFTEIVNSVVNVIQYTLLLIGAVGAVVGAIRKVWNTVTGQNASVNLTSSEQPNN